MNETLLRITGVGLFFGLAFLFTGISQLVKEKKKARKYTEKTVGTVTELVRRTSKKSKTRINWAWFPVFEYTVGDKTYSKEYKYGHSQAQYGVGQEVEIYYKPDKPGNFRVEGDSLPKKIAGIMAAIGAVLTVIFAAGLVFLFMSR